MVYKWTNFIQSARALNWLYPSNCLICGARGEHYRDLCAACFSDLPWNHKACPRCALPLPAGSVSITLCAQCLTNAASYDSAWSLFRFVEPLRHLHRQLKFAEKLSHARLLGQLLADALEERKLKETGMAPDRIVVMPLHAGRLRQRGFNQALELIRPAATRLEIPLDLQSCRRVRATAAQTGLAAGQRKKNVRGAFACDAALNGQSVVIFDDVVTTGHTVAELARVVNRAGAKRVEIWSLARAP